MSWRLTLKVTISIMNTSPSRLTSIRTAVALIIAIVAVLAIVTVGFGGAPKPPTATPSPSPAGSPTNVPSPDPTETPSASPSVPADHGPIVGDVTIDLVEASRNDVKATVRDESGDVVGVRSGTPGDGMSVSWHDIAVENVDARTLRITWVGTGDEETVHVAVSAEADGYLVEIVQNGLGPNSDSIGYDRELILSFEQSVDAADVTGGVADRNPS